jgi:ureidoglycolate dehydrogenase (NAD+)
MSTNPTPSGLVAADGSRVVSFAALHRFCVRALLATSLSEVDARTGADVLATTDAWGVHSHGTRNLRGYLRRLLAGGLRPDGDPHVVAEDGSWAIVDADSSLGMVGSVFAMRVAIEKARVHGIAYVGVRNSCHFGAAGYYTCLAANDGLIGIAVANDTPSVAAPGSRAPVLGSNPISYAVPAGRHHPMFLDISIATVAGQKVWAARERGLPVPETWLVGPDGRPTSDASLYPHSGALAPAAGHKGYGLGLLGETLAGIVSGAAVTWGVLSWMIADQAVPTGHGAGFIAIDCDAMMPSGQMGRRMEALIDEVHAAPRADGVERLYVPGEMEWERHDRAMTTGIVLAPDLVAALAESAALTGLDLEADLA